jgi:hypothetical protein
VKPFGIDPDHPVPTAPVHIGEPRAPNDFIPLVRGSRVNRLGKRLIDARQKDHDLGIPCEELCFCYTVKQTGTVDGMHHDAVTPWYGTITDFSLKMIFALGRENRANMMLVARANPSKAAITSTVTTTLGKIPDGAIWP